MSEPLEIVEAGSFCWNEACAYERLGAGNLRRYGKTRGGVLRFQCTRCNKVFAATHGPPFYGVHDPAKMLLDSPWSENVSACAASSGSRGPSRIRRWSGWRGRRARGVDQAAAPEVAWDGAGAIGCALELCGARG